MNIKTARLVLPWVLLLAARLPLGADNPIELKLSSFTPAPHIMNTRIFPPWIQEIEHRSGGQVRITLFPGSALGKPEDHFEMAAKGVADITWGLTAYTPGRFPLTSVMDLPFMSPSTDVGSRMIWRLFEQGYFAGEYEEVKVLSLGATSNIELHTRNKPVRSMADLKGLRVRVTSPAMGRLLKSWGAVPVSMPVTEVYLALERGVIDGLLIDPMTLYAMRCNEVTRYHTRIRMLNSPFFVVMNRKSWDRLPQEARKVFDDLSGEYFSADLNGELVIEAEAQAWKRLEAEGHTVFDLSPEEQTRWEEAAQSVRREWISEMKARKLPADDVLTAALLLKKELTARK